MKPLDPRLLRYARSTRGFLVLGVVIGVLTAILVIVQARLLSSVIVDVSSQGLTWDAVSRSVLILAGVFALRALAAWASEAAAFRTAARAKQELREITLRHLLELGPSGPAGEDPGSVATLITRGVDGLDGYFARYLPQLILAAIVPLAVVLTVLGQDLLSTLIIAITLPLIPLFMALIGLYTKDRVDRTRRRVSRPSSRRRPDRVLRGPVHPRPRAGCLPATAARRSALPRGRGGPRRGRAHVLAHRDCRRARDLR